MSIQPDIILASKSAGRKAMLTDVGLKYKSIAADIDEAAIIKNSNLDIKSVTEKLAVMKALHISEQYPDAYVIGSDQTLEFEGELICKSKDSAQAEQKLKQMRGKTHILRSSVCVALGSKSVFTHTSDAKLTMHDFDDDFLARYMDSDPDALTSCVGGYKIEGTGAWLFSEITGDVFTIMGMPLLPLLAFLRKNYGVNP